MKHTAKKQKLDSTPSNSTKSTENSLECVLPDDILNNSVPSVQVYVGTVPDKKLIRQAIVDLNKVLPVIALQHLKRVKKDKVIICFSSEGSEYDVFRKLNNLGFNLKLINDKLDTVNVPKCAPKTRRQFNFCVDLWPTNFHEDKYLESLLSGSVFKHEELKEHETFMRTALEAARRSEFHCGTVIVNPKNKSIIAVAGDMRNSHPLKHSIMVGVDLVAQSQGGGAWEPSSADFYTRDLSNSAEPSSEGPYLCTGFTAYTLREPCTMCSMALVHCRIKRVFYALSSSSDGALGSLLKVHTLKNLNHHFEVFRGLLKDEAQSLL